MWRSKASLLIAALLALACARAASAGVGDDWPLLEHEADEDDAWSHPESQDVKEEFMTWVSQLINRMGTRKEHAVSLRTEALNLLKPSPAADQEGTVHVVEVHMAVVQPTVILSREAVGKLPRETNVKLLRGVAVSDNRGRELGGRGHIGKLLI